jgi:ribonuclease Z
MPFKLTILGCSSATPTLYRHSSAQILNVNERLFLIDCGEGAQMQLRRYGIKFQRIDHIFISHLHGDHYLGLMGLLFTLHLLGRTKPLHLYANNGLREVLDIQMELSNTTLLYPLEFHSVNHLTSEVILETKDVQVRTIPLEHRIPTVGFLFKETEKPRKLNKQLIDSLKISVEAILEIKNGSGYTDSKGMVYSNEELTLKPGTPASYAYCSDTAYTESFIPIIKNVRLLYHEATFMHDRVKNAREKFHSTTIDAATIALKANAGKLLIGHYSARYDDLQPLLDETRTVFPDSILAEEGKDYYI